MRTVACVVVLAGGSVALAGDPWADRVELYEAGSNPDAGYTNAAAALGGPSRMTGEADWISTVTPFNAPWLADQLVSIGAGGSLVLAFDEPVRNDAANPFGFDLLLFGNAFLEDASWPSGNATGAVFGAATHIDVSVNGEDWAAVSPGALGPVYPTLGYADLSGPYPLLPGEVPTDFTRPVDPSLDVTGMNWADIFAAYAGSGGGTGIDLGALGLDEVSYVRIWNPSGSPAVEIDAVADVSPVPAGGAAGVFAVAGLAAAQRRRRR